MAQPGSMNQVIFGILSAAHLFLATAATAAPFKHPGVLVNRAQLAQIRAKVEAGTEPWKSGFASMSSHRAASLTYAPRPRATVECGSYSNPDLGCTDETNDAISSYTHALMWNLTGKEAHARKAVEILNAWSATLKAHTNSNAPLQSAWASSVTSRAAEIMKHTYAGWASADAERYAAFLKAVYVPLIQNGSPANGNWELSMIEALSGIAVFTDDQALFDRAVSMWRKRVPAYFYLATDGPLPVRPPVGNRNTEASLITYWHGQKTFMDGLSQETCRDFGHVQFGIAAAINVAETALQQGLDLYGEESRRLTAALEFHAGYLNGKAVPASLCGGSLDLSKGNTWEIAYNHYSNRRGLDLPATRSLLGAIRPTRASFHMVWETLTHAEVGKVGVETSISTRQEPGARAQGAGVRILSTAGGGSRVLAAVPDAQGGLRHFGMEGALESR